MNVSTIPASDLVHGFTCRACGLSTPQPLIQGEARLLASTHDRIHHGGARTATTWARPLCESCQHRAATTTWAHPQAGAPFALCTDCATQAATVGAIDQAQPDEITVAPVAGAR